jgi:hypothetical protein
MDEVSVSRASAANAARLDRTIKDLQTCIIDQEAAWEKVRGVSSFKSHDVNQN